MSWRIRGKSLGRGTYLRRIPTRPGRRGWGPSKNFSWASGRVGQQASQTGERLAHSPTRPRNKFPTKKRTSLEVGRVGESDGRVTRPLSHSTKKQISRQKRTSWASGRVGESLSRLTRPLARETFFLDPPTPPAWASGYVPNVCASPGEVFSVPPTHPAWASQKRPLLDTEHFRRGRHFI